MPSGAKKRKALKKKQKKESNINSATTSHENDDLKTQESDGGEVSSSVAHNHHEDKEQAIPARQNVLENTSGEIMHNDGDDTQKLVAEDVDDVFVTRDWGVEQDPEKNEVDVEHVEFEKISHNRSSSSSSSSSDDSGSSSDDESHVNEKTQERDLVSDNLAVEHEIIADSEKLGESVIEKVPGAESILLRTTQNFNVVGTEVNDEIVETLFSMIDNKSNVIDNQVLPLSYEDGGGVSSSPNDVVIEENGDNAPILETSTSEERMKDSEFPEYSEKQPLVAAAARQEQTTSWKGCCGLFEVLAGSKS